jgi:uncharacterized protein with ParB-like and HNH nuclease domain
VPEYQRSYVWEYDQITELIDDIKFAQINNPDTDYFLGSMVLQKNKASLKHNGNTINYIEFDVLDGQQRLTTLLLLISVLRDITNNLNLKANCQKYIFQQEDEFENIPERLRLVYSIRDNVEDFIGEFIKKENGTSKKKVLIEKSSTKNVSISNMSKAILKIQQIFTDWTEDEISSFAKFLFNNVLVIYVATEDLEDAFRLFTILNDRGMPLTNSDILKAQNLGALANNAESEKYAIFWEETEGDFGRDEFERLLSFIRTILVKDKARDNILKEFKEKVYESKPPLLVKGKNTLDFIKKYVDIYNKIYWFTDLPSSFTNEYRNLVSVMSYGLPSTDWVPPLLRYYDKFGEHDILIFLKKLDNKFSSDWIVQLTPTFRIQNMNDILKAIDNYSTTDELLADNSVFSVNEDSLISMLSDNIYGRRFTRYILLKLEYLLKDHSSQFAEFSYVSVEHILPQNPGENSNWWQNFDEETHAKWLNKIGNLLLLSRRKNTQLSNSEFLKKKDRYFSGNIDAFPNSLRVMQYNEWTEQHIIDRQKELLDLIKKHYSI